MAPQIKKARVTKKEQPRNVYAEAAAEPKEEQEEVDQMRDTDEVSAALITPSTVDRRYDRRNLLEGYFEAPKERLEATWWTRWAAPLPFGRGCAFLVAKASRYATTNAIAKRHSSGGYRIAPETDFLCPHPEARERQRLLPGPTASRTSALHLHVIADQLMILGF